MTMSSKEKCADEMEWSAEEAIQLFFALEGLKPVGVNKHFYMACIAERLSKSLNRDIPAEAIWAYLRTLYNLDVLDEMEPLPFPNEQKDFFLPDTEFSVLMSRKQAENEEKKQLADSSGTATIGSGISNTSTQGNSSNNSNTKSTEKHSSTSNKIIANPSSKELEKKISTKLIDAPKRTPKRTRGSMSLESNSPSTTPPPLQSNKRRRI